MFSNLCNDLRLGVLRCLLSRVKVTCVTGQTGAGVKCGSKVRPLVRRLVSSFRCQGRQVSLEGCVDSGGVTRGFGQRINLINRLTGEHLTKGTGSFTLNFVHTATRYNQEAKKKFIDWLKQMKPQYMSPAPASGAARQVYVTGAMSFFCSYIGWFWLQHSEVAPVTNRRRVLFFKEEIMPYFKSSTEQVLDYWNLEHRILPQMSEQTQKVQKVIDKLTAANRELTSDWKFVAVVIDTDGYAIDQAESSAYGPILISKSLVENFTEDQLGFIMAHEMSHIILQHMVERTSHLLFWEYFLIYTASYVTNVLTFTFDEVRPWFEYFLQNKELQRNKTAEHEADTVGLQLMAMACIHPRAAEEVLERWIVQPPARGTFTVVSLPQPSPDPEYTELMKVKDNLYHLVRAMTETYASGSEHPTFADRLNNVYKQKQMLLSIISQQNCQRSEY